MKSFFLLAVFLVHLLALVPAALAEKRLALVVGNAEYVNLGRLKNPGNDARLIARSLRQVGFEVTEVLNADRNILGQAVLDFGGRLQTSGPNTVGLFYFAGHGVQSRGRNFLIPVSAPINVEGELTLNAIDAGWILDQMTESGSRMNIVILDACRNNPFVGSKKSANRGLAKMEAPTGTILGYAAAAGAVAEDGHGNNGPYASSLAKAMLSPGKKVEDVFKAVRVEVRRKTLGRQTPWEESSLLGDFYFIPPATIPSGLGNDVRAAYEEAIRIGTRQAFKAVVLSWPGTHYARLAQTQIDQIADAELSAASEAGTRLAYLEFIDRWLGTLHEHRARRLLDQLRNQQLVAAIRQGTKASYEAFLRDWPESDSSQAAKTALARLAAEDYAAAVQDGSKEALQAFVARWPDTEQAKAALAAMSALATEDGFRDCARCPLMVVVPEGRFTMGSPDREHGRSHDESPRHSVSLESFALGKYEVTFDEYEACVDDGGCKPVSGAEGLARGSMPIINVSWNDARDYVNWLSRKTGKAYRLPSEAEWEYAARAGTTSPFSIGKAMKTKHANFDATITSKGFTKDDRMQVGSFAPNAWGLHDMHGNVWEWVEDCWHTSYERAPRDGSAWTGSGNCNLRVLRGGSWYERAEKLRSANRHKHHVTHTDTDDGFRVARSLDR